MGKITPRKEHISERTRAEVLKRDDYKCVGCGETNNIQVDHVVTWSLGGGEELLNLRTLCRKCNVKRTRYLSHCADTINKKIDRAIERLTKENKELRKTCEILEVLFKSAENNSEVWEDLYRYEKSKKKD